LPFLKSLGGKQKSFKVEVGQIVWPDDWYAQLYLETQGDRYRMFVGLKHDPDETRKVLAEMQQAGGVTLRKERCVG